MQNSYNFCAHWIFYNVIFNNENIIYVTMSASLNYRIHYTLISFFLYLWTLIPSQPLYV